MTAGTLAAPHFAPGVSAWQRRRLGRVMRDAFAPHDNPLRRYLSAMAGFSEAAAEKILGHVFAKTEFAKPAKIFLAIGKEAAATGDTGASIEASKEANYTGYARLELKPAEFKLTKATMSSIKNEAELVMAACTAGSSTIISFWVTEKKKGEACNVIMWGSVTSVTISSTQTPPVVAPEKLAGELE